MDFHVINETNDSYYDDLVKPGQPMPLYILFYVIIFGFCAVVGSFGNSLVILTILYDRTLRLTRNMFIVSLALSDFFVSSVTMPASIAGVIYGHSWFEGHPALCTFVSTICAPGCVASMYSVAWIAKYHVYLKHFTKTRVAVYLLSTWFMGFSIHIPNHIGWGQVRFSHMLKLCTLDTDLHSYAVFYACVLLAAILVAFLFYVKIYVNLRHSKLAKSVIVGTKTRNAGQIISNVEMTGKIDNVEMVITGKIDNVEITGAWQRKRAYNSKAETQKVHAKEDSKRKQNLKTEIQVIKASFRVFVLFLLTWSPIAVLLLVHIGAKVPSYVYVYCGLLAHANSTLNFLVYFLANEVFRRSLYKFLRNFCSADRNKILSATPEDTRFSKCP
uniref:G-protein coupled receptors family 1 profile domain-containing protein n=1 Tax=Romanomermis culicivorax TaxID=13658 RepID=A0A915IS76_ROMCU